MKDLTVLMTGAGAPGAYGIIRCLRNNGERDIRIIGVDADPQAGCRELVDVFQTVPMAADDAFIPAVLEVCEKHHVDVVQPIVTRELQKFAENKRRFEAIGTKVCVSDPDRLRIINDKGNLFDAMKKRGDFRLPRYFLVHGMKEYVEAMESLDWHRNPVCIKVTFGNGSRGIRFVDSEKSLFSLFMKEKPDSKYVSYDGMLDILKDAPEFPELMVMELLTGEEYSADVLADRGNIVYYAGRRSPIVRSSITLQSEISDNEDIRKQCEFIVKTLALSGNIGFDFRCGKNGYPYILEINPRLTATVVLNAVAGINFPYMGVKYALGEPLPVLDLKHGIRLKRRYEETYADARGNILEY